MKCFSSLVSFVLLTVHVANAAVYQDVSALPTNQQYDVIVVGGQWRLLRMVSPLSRTDTFIQVVLPVPSLRVDSLRIAGLACCLLKPVLST